MRGLGEFAGFADGVGTDCLGISPLLKLLRSSASFLVVQRLIPVLDTVSSQISQSDNIKTNKYSRNVRLFDRYIRSQQHHPRLGLRHLLPNQGEESLFSRHRQLYRCRIIHLDSVYVAFL
jgi:hypothetical protein